MKPLDARYRPNEDYKELFDLMVDPNKCIVTLIGVMKDGTFLYIKETLMNNSSAYWMDTELYSIDKEEFLHYVEEAKSKGNIEKAIKQNKITEEELEALCK